MIYWIGFYWLCAGLASFSIDKLVWGGGTTQFVASMLTGGFMIPVRIMAKAAR